MSVVTISRQLGSQGTTLGRKIAVQLGYRLVHREIINQAAQLAQSPDMALATIDELGLLGIEPEENQQKAYLQSVETIMKKMATEGNIVIVGRAGQAILKDRPNILHVRVIAPIDTRIQRIIAAHNVSPKAARAQIEDSDRYRKNYLEKFYNIDWNDPALYHLVINTGQIGLNAATEVVCTALNQLSAISKSQEPPLE